MRTNLPHALDQCEEIDKTRVSGTGRSVEEENMDVFVGSCESGHESHLRREVQNSDGEKIPRRFTCHEIQYNTENRRKENNETHKSISCLRGSDMSSTARRNSRNVSRRDCSDLHQACCGRSNEICPSSPSKSKDNFAEIKLGESKSERKHTPTPMTDILVRSVTPDSLKESLKTVTQKNSDGESQTTTNSSIDSVSSNFVSNNIPPESPQLRPPSSPSRNTSSTSAQPQNSQSSNSRRSNGVGERPECLPVRPAPRGNSSENSSNLVPVCLPHTLQDTIVNYLVRRLGVAVWNWREDNTRSIEAFVSSYRRAVPSHIRSLMLERVLQEGRVWHTVTLRLLQLLLGADCSTALRVWQVRVFFRDQFLACLTPLARLTVLRVEDPTWRCKPQQEALLCAALPQLQQLQLLSLHYLASDAVVAAAVDSCHRLQVLDVFFSSAVTNKGAHWLLGRRDASVQAACSPIRPQRRKRWFTSAVTWLRRAPGKRRKAKRDSRPVLLAGRHSSKCQERLRTRTGSSNSALASSRASLVPEEGALVDNQAFSPVKLLPHLRVLDLRGTSVSRAVIMEITEVRPELKVLAITSASE